MTNHDAELITRDAFKYFHTVPTRWMDNDVYGHVNNVVYYAWIDTAINAHLIAKAGLDIKRAPIVGVVVETLCRYHREITFPDTVHVGIRVHRLGRTSVTYHIGIFRNDDPTPSATGHFVHVYINRETREAVRVPLYIRAILDGLTEEATVPQQPALTRGED